MRLDRYSNDRRTPLSFAQPLFTTHMKSFSLDHVRIRRFGEVALIHAESVPS
jgi:hypothetical protein